MTDEKSISRRRALAGMVGSAAALPAAGRAIAAGAEATVPLSPAAANVCRMTPRMVEGPFYFDPTLVRRDIAEGRTGVPLKLVLQVTDGTTCQPIVGARVDVWHCDATGQYSGYDGQGDGREISTKGEKFLRGTQITGSGGEAEFTTIYPGWYRGRTTHIHFKVLLDEKAMLTGQMYFPDALSEYIFTNIAPYNTRSGKRDTLNGTDFIAGADGDHISFVNVREEADTYVATLVIGVDRNAEPERSGSGRPPGPPPGMGPPLRGSEDGPLAPRGSGSIVPGPKKS
jgi:protocatechuate 3,4-dioxygenase beta subunit